MSKKAFIIDGGAGRVIASMPALEKYAKNNNDEDFIIVVHGFETLFFGNPLLTEKTFSANQKGLFKELKNAEIIKPEPYFHIDYMNQRCSLAEAFDKIINETNDHSDLGKPKFYLNSREKEIGIQVINDAQSKQKKSKTVVIQPFGSSFQYDEKTGKGLDESSRSLSIENYLKLATRLAKKYNLIFMGTTKIDRDLASVKIDLDHRLWASVISSADYFVGVDSMGQHISYATGTPSTVIMGSTFPINVSYPETHHIVEKKDIHRTYSPIRLAMFDSHLADRANDGIMDFTTEEIDEVVEKINERLNLKK